MSVAIPFFVVVLALGPSQARAEVTVETAPLLTREAAESVLASAQDALPDALGEGTRLRLVRRYVRGLGWRHFVVAEGVAEGRPGALLAAALAVEGTPATVLGASETAGEGPGSPSLGAAAAPPAPQTIPAAPTETSDSTPVAGQRPRSKSAAVVVRAAARAHGGETDIRARIEAADRVEFQFVRSLPAKGPLVARHAYTRSGAARRLDVSLVSGDGTDSSAGVDRDGTAWLQETGSEVLSRDAKRLTEVVDRFSPAAVLSAGLDLGLELATGAAWEGLQRVGETGGSVVVLRPATPVVPGGLVEAVFDASTHRLQQVTWRRGGGEITFLYADFADLGDGLVIPKRMSVRQRDTTIEEIEVESLLLNGKVGDSRFTRPAR